MDTKGLLDRLAQRDTGSTGLGIAHGLDKYCPQYSINTPLRLAHFLAQACHETGGFKWLKEIWGPTNAQKRYDPPSDLAKKLGNDRDGDGRLYCGRGIFQLTGRDNYRRIGAALALPLEIEPELACDPVMSVKIACHYWMTHGLNALADADDVVGITRKINGGTNGLADRQACLKRAKELLHC